MVNSGEHSSVLTVPSELVLTIHVPAILHILHPECLANQIRVPTIQNRVIPHREHQPVQHVHIPHL